MSYASGMLEHRITFVEVKGAKNGEYGRETDGWRKVATVHAAATFNKGVRAMREGAVDAYDTIMFRLRWHPQIHRECRILYDGRVYAISSYNSDRRRNTIQITATELVGDKVSLYGV